MSAISDQRLDMEELKAEVLHLKAKGLRVAEIALKLEMTGRDVNRILNQAATFCRNRHRDEIDVLWAVQAEREENVWRLIQEELDRAQAQKFFPRDAVTSAIRLLERQAKRTGLDITQSKLSNEWLEDRTDDELIEIARQMGIPIGRNDNGHLEIANVQ